MRKWQIECFGFFHPLQNFHGHITSYKLLPPTKKKSRISIFHCLEGFKSLKLQILPPKLGLNSYGILKLYHAIFQILRKYL